MDIDPSKGNLTRDIEVEIEQSIPFTDRLKAVGTAASTDYKESQHKIQKIGVGVGVIAMQSLDRLRASVIFVPEIAVNVLQNTHSPVEAALAGGAAFATWCTVVGGVTNEGLHQFPVAVESFEDNFPGAVEFFSDALPGVNSPSSEEIKKQSVAKRIGNRIILGLKRGYTVSGIGTVAYVSTASVQGKSKKEGHKLNLNASLDGGAAVSGVVLMAGEAIVRIGDSNPELAKNIQDYASNIKLWYGVAAFMIISNFISNRLNKRSKKEVENVADSVKPEQ